MTTVHNGKMELAWYTGWYTGAGRYAFTAPALYVWNRLLGLPCLAFSIAQCHLSLSLVTVARVHSTPQPCSSNQCDTARLESKLTRCSNDVHLISSHLISSHLISSHEDEHSFSNEAQRLVYRQLRCRTKRRLRDTKSVADSYLVHSSTLISPSFVHSSQNCQN